MLSTIIYIIAVVLISAIYIVSCWRMRKRYADMYEECVNINDRNYRWWRSLCEDLEKEKDELTVKLCEAEMWCEVGYPDENERVLVCSVTKKGDKRINIAYYENGSWHGNGNLDNVIAWKALPEMPEGGEE